jgi:hypothetical protein
VIVLSFVGFWNEREENRRERERERERRASKEASKTTTTNTQYSHDGRTCITEWTLL